MEIMLQLKFQSKDSSFFECCNNAKCGNHSVSKTKNYLLNLSCFSGAVEMQNMENIQWPKLQSKASFFKCCNNAKCANHSVSKNKNE